MEVDGPLRNKDAPGPVLQVKPAEGADPGEGHVSLAGFTGGADVNEGRVEGEPLRLVDGRGIAVVKIAIAALIDLDARADMVLLGVDEASVAAMVQEYPFYQLYTIPAGTYPDVTEDTLVINDPATIFTRQDADPALVEGMMAAVFDHLDQLGQVHGVARLITPETAVNVPIPLHPGADAYFAGQ